MPASDEAAKLKKKAKASLTLLLVAVISITTATYAWFTLSNSTSVQSMEVRVGTGTKLMVSTSDSGTLADPWNGYVSELTTEMVNDALYDQCGYRLDDIRLWPLSSGDGYHLYTQQGNVSGPASAPETKYYLDLDLWFRSSVDMDVYLNEDVSSVGADDGTLISSKDDNTNAQSPVDHAARMSFTTYDSGGDPNTDAIVIYEPNKSGDTNLNGRAKADGGAVQNTFTELGDNTGLQLSQAVFSLKADTPKQVTIRLWIEGEDPQCVNGNGTGADKDTNLEKAHLLAQLRFCGAGPDGKFIETTVT